MVRCRIRVDISEIIPIIRTIATGAPNMDKNTIATIGIAIKSRIFSRSGSSFLSVSIMIPCLRPSFFSSFWWILSARSDEAELDVARGALVAVDAGAAIGAATVAAVAAVAAVGLAIGVSVGTCANKLPARAIEHIQRTNNFFIERLIIGCSKRPIWIQRFWGFRGQLKGCVAHLAGHYCPSQNCGCSSVGRAPPCQGGRREFEPRHPLQPSLEKQQTEGIENVFDANEGRRLRSRSLWRLRFLCIKRGLILSRTRSTCRPKNFPTPSSLPIRCANRAPAGWSVG